MEFERIRQDLNGSTDPVQNAALRLARGEIGLADLDDLRSRIGGPREDPEEA